MGYVRHQETGLYYLQSRYYNPEWGRFLNADTFVSTGQGPLGNNMFAYCGNNPINCIDGTGHFPWHVVAGALIGGSVKAVSALISGKRGWDVFVDAVYGAVSGAFVAAHPSCIWITNSVDLLITFIECVQAGYTAEETMAIMAIAIAAGFALPSTGDEFVDVFVDATFGTAKNLSATAATTAIGNSSNGKFVTNNITTAISGQGNSGGCSKYFFKQAGRHIQGDILWI